MAVHDHSDNILEMLNSAFSRVLPLLVGRALPGRDCVDTEEFFNTFGNLNLCPVRDEFGGGSLFSDTVLKRIDKLLLTLQSIDVKYFSVATHK